jgi:saccharopine dehydrogenase-like NADP-dependent oxidoreductase
MMHDCASLPKTERTMKTILILGAGLSSGSLIDYLEQAAKANQWRIRVADRNVESARQKTTSPTEVIAFDMGNLQQLEAEVAASALVISLLPAKFHQMIAKVCIRLGKSLMTASYESPGMKKLDAEARRKGILLLNEMGLDPGIDHMSAMQVIDRIREDGHQLTVFESFTGGLIASESDDNPWHYKFTWNPFNVVMAGWPGPAQFIQSGRLKYIPYNRLFRRTEYMHIEGYGRFEGYANRDSLKYIEKYNLQGIPTIYRGTLRRPGFSKAWNVFVQLGATDNSYIMKNTEELTHREFINSFLYYHPKDSVEVKLYREFHIDQDSPVIEMLEWLDIFSEERIGIKNGTPAQLLHAILAKKWQLREGDNDMVVMWHKFDYIDKTTGREVKLTSSMGVTGEGRSGTAMSKTVGLPLAIAAKLYLTGQIRVSGAVIPTIREIYEPVLSELKSCGIIFREKELK